MKLLISLELYAIYQKTKIKQGFSKMVQDVSLEDSFDGAKKDKKTQAPAKSEQTKQPVISQIPLHLLQSRQVFLNDGVTKDSVNKTMLQLRALADQNKEPITLWINSPGGSVYDGLALYDVMREIMNEGVTIKTKAFGMAASMGSFLLSAGTPGHREMLPSSKDMTHQPSRLAGRLNEDDFQNSSKSISQTRRRMEMHYADFMGLDYRDEKAMELINNYMGPDSYLNAYMAKRLGLVDSISMIGADNRPDESLSQEFLKRSIEIDIHLSELEYNEIDTSENSKDPLRFVKRLIEYRETYLANKAMEAKCAANENQPQHIMVDP